MKLCYQVATPDVKIDPSVTAFQGTLENSFSFLSQAGYDGVEFMTLNPQALDWHAIDRLKEQKNLDVVLVCTGEICGQLGLTFMDADPERRAEAIRRVKGIIDFAAAMGGNVNIGRVRGQYQHDIPDEVTLGWAVDAMKELSEYSGKKNVYLAMENVTIMQTNFINTVGDAVDFTKLVDNPYCKIMMDLFHMHIEEKDYFETIRTYQPYNVHVHLADNNRRYPGHCGLDFTKILTAFRDAGYDGPFCTEIYQIPNQEEAALGAIRHLAPIAQAVYGRPVKASV
ncbi:MAG: TIM barrel protein [Eubacteriales bacterium]|jgi:sugar phosphate isomerase/epimerase